jgi:hypothetical protein
MRIGGLGVSLATVVMISTLGCSRGKSGGSDAGLVPALMSAIHANEASGHVESTGATGTWQLDKGDCYSGDNDGYFGIVVTSRADKRVWVKLVKDPIKGWNVGASIPDTCKAVPNGQKCDVQYFDDRACSTLDVGLRTTTFKGKYSRGGHQFDGNVSFDCAADKAHVSGKLAIEKCAP